MLNEKKPSRLEQVLKDFTEALQNVGFQVTEQRNTQAQLDSKIQQFLTAQELMRELTQKSPDNA